MEQLELRSREIFAFAAREKYDPKKGWDSIAQPEVTSKACMTVSDYTELARQLLPNFQNKIDTFLANNKLRAIHVSQNVWHDEFETSTLTFREWLKDYCARTGQSMKSDVLVVDACVKEEKRWNEKLTNDIGDSYAVDPSNPIYTKDGLRGMIIKLAQHSKTKDLNGFGDLIDSLENSSETLARNNQLYKPHTHGYRGYHAVWNSGELTDPSQPWSGLGLSMNGEIKLEHENQQELNRLTRHIQEITRAERSVQATFFVACGTDSGTHAVRLDTWSKSLKVLGRSAYDYLHAKMGFDRFLGEGVASDRSAIPTTEELNKKIRDITHNDIVIRNLIAESGLKAPQIKLPTYVPVVA